MFPRKFWQVVVTNQYLEIGEKREDESRITPGFRPLWLGGKKITFTRGWKRKLVWGEAAELTLGHGELVYQWNIEPKMPNRQLEFGSWRVGWSYRLGGKSALFNSDNPPSNHIQLQTYIEHQLCTRHCRCFYTRSHLIFTTTQQGRPYYSCLTYGKTETKAQKGLVIYLSWHSRCIKVWFEPIVSDSK